MTKFVYDSSFKPGDLIQAYRKGYHQFLSYIPRARGRNPLVRYRSLLDNRGNPVRKSKVLECDAYWCRKVTRDILDTVDRERADNFLRVLAFLEAYKESLQ